MTFQDSFCLDSRKPQKNSNPEKFEKVLFFHLTLLSNEEEREWAKSTDRNK